MLAATLASELASRIERSLRERGWVADRLGQLAYAVQTYRRELGEVVLELHENVKDIVNRQSCCEPAPVASPSTPAPSCTEPPPCPVPGYGAEA